MMPRCHALTPDFFAFTALLAGVDISMGAAERAIAAVGSVFAAALAAFLWFGSRLVGAVCGVSRSQRTSSTRMGTPQKTKVAAQASFPRNVSMIGTVSPAASV